MTFWEFLLAVWSMGGFVVATMALDGGGTYSLRRYLIIVLLCGPLTWIATFVLALGALAYNFTHPRKK